MNEMGKLIWWGWMIFLMQYATAQNGLGNRLAGADALFTPKPGLWGNNVYSASLALQKNVVGGLYGEQRFMTDLHYFQALLGFTVKNHAFQWAYSREGIPEFAHSRLAISSGMMVSRGLMIGMGIGYASTKIRGYDTYGELDAGFGALLQLHEKVRFGIQLNRIPALFKKESNYGFLARVGLGYSFSDVCALSVQAIKEAERPVIVDLGLWYSFHEHFYMRMGFSAAISLASFTLGYRRKQFTIDVCSAYHLTLGGSWGLAMVYQFNNSE